jgi:hypothetical protein
MTCDLPPPGRGLPGKEMNVGRQVMDESDFDHASIFSRLLIQVDLP